MSWEPALLNFLVFAKCPLRGYNTIYSLSKLFPCSVFCLLQRNVLVILGIYLFFLKAETPCCCFFFQNICKHIRLHSRVSLNLLVSHQPTYMYVYLLCCVFFSTRHKQIFGEEGSSVEEVPLSDCLLKVYGVSSLVNDWSGWVQPTVIRGRWYCKPWWAI